MKNHKRKKRLRLSMERYMTGITAKMVVDSSEYVNVTILADKHSVSIRMGISRFTRLVRELRSDVERMSEFMRRQEYNHNWKANMLDSSIAREK